MEVRYWGDAPGQADRISINGIEFHRGRVYDIDDDLAKVLLARGGFIRPEDETPPEAPKVKHRKPKAMPAPKINVNESEDADATRGED